MLVLTRQDVPVLRTDELGRSIGLSMGAYILEDSDDSDPELILIASGSEVALALEARHRLAASGVSTRVVSMPSWELFREQDPAYQAEVLPPHIKNRLAIEAGVSLGWREWIGAEGDVIAIDTFGASAPADELFERFGFTVENVVARAMRLVEGA
jgi:transketolase